MRTFLSWKDVRKNVKDDKGEANVVVAPEAEELVDESVDKSARLRKLSIKFSWDLLHGFSDFQDWEEDDDEEDREAYEHQKKRLKVRKLTFIG
jgi:hypothetical protein